LWRCKRNKTKTKTKQFTCNMSEVDTPPPGEARSFIASLRDLILMVMEAVHVDSHDWNHTESLVLTAGLELGA